MEVKSKKLKVEKREDAAAPWLRSLPFYFLLFTSLCIAFAFTPASAQDEPEIAPPPLKVIPKDERMRLDAETDVKDRTKLSLEMMDERLVTAEKFAAQQDFNDMFTQLGVFHGLLDNSVEFLSRRDDHSSKVLDCFKKLEIALRKFAPRLETIHRELPIRYEEYLRKLMRTLRDARAKAMDTQFSDTVIPRKQ